MKKVLLFVVLSLGIISDSFAGSGNSCKKISSYRGNSYIYGYYTPSSYFHKSDFYYNKARYDEIFNLRIMFKGQADFSVRLCSGRGYGTTFQSG